MKVRPGPAGCRAPGRLGRGARPDSGVGLAEAVRAAQLSLRVGPRRWAAACCALAMLALASMLIGVDAMAQANACDLLKATLAEGSEATGVRGYSLEAVPAGAPVPSDAKAIGNCETGAYKVLYRRWGATQAAASGVASAAQTAATPRTGAAADEPMRRSTAVQDDRALQARAAAPAVRPLAAPASPPASAAAPTPAPAPATAPPVAPMPISVPASAPEKAATPGASEAQAVRSVEPSAARAPPRLQQAASGVPLSLAQQTAAFAEEHWQWICILVLVPIVAVLWAWRAYRNAYDEAGLPRGPKL